MVDAAVLEIERPGLAVQRRRALRIGSLRYFDAAGPLDSALRGVVGGPLPAALKALRYPVASSREEIILAWRSPTETLVLTEVADAFDAVAAKVAGQAHAGCLIEQTGGLSVWQVNGARIEDLISRLGSNQSIPALGEARVSRMAELPVMTLCVREGELMMLVERVYDDHLLGWIRETAADL